MIGGLIAAVIGPQLVIATREAIPGASYAGSFLSQAALALIALPVLSLLHAPRPTAVDTVPEGGRSIPQLLSSPAFLLALAAGVVSYGLTAFVMTAVPMAMVGHGHSIDHAALGIQWHVLAMFAPSLITGKLIARFGKERVTGLGLLIIGLSGGVALSGLGVLHFYASLVFLGAGWNFGFIGATAMVADEHYENERSKAQGLNDFVVFGTVALSSFFSGALLQTSGWQLINLMIFPTIAPVLAPLVWRVARREIQQGGEPMPETFRAMQVAEPGRLELVERPVPEPGAGEVLIAVEACGICGADRGDIGNADPAAKRVPDHEVIGRIISPGANVPAVWKVGQRVGVGGSAGPAPNARPAAAAATICAAISP